MAKTSGRKKGGCELGEKGAEAATASSRLARDDKQTRSRNVTQVGRAERGKTKTKHAAMQVEEDERMSECRTREREETDLMKKKVEEEGEGEEEERWV
jgi:hypothetical protein